ncbi:MAG: cytochrome b/b6 domain-containing protein [Deltaproteobacteria bacterium]|nr:cytochrome b/b6 domain-containing protein [Deltaproteobacteria bacterium]
MRRSSVVRHSLVVRLLHWLVAGSGVLLLFSGIGEMPVYKRYNLVKVPGFGWAADYELNLQLHYVAAFVFMAAAFFHLVYHLRREEFAALPRRGDLRESAHILKAILLGKPEPPHGKFLAEQRLAYAAFGATSLVLVLTGLLKTYKNLGAIVVNPEMLQGVTLAHTAATMLFALLVVLHLGAFLPKANRPLLPSMFTGRVDGQYARRRHPHWLEAPKS